MSVLDDPNICDLLRQAWEESRPGTEEGHEEGGFVLRGSDGLLTVERWPHGERNEIVVPPHPGGMCGQRLIVATFHTHPNIGPEFLQEPSPTDIRGVCDDPDLQHHEYEGEYVISKERLYRICSDGTVQDMGATNELLNIDG